MSRRYVLSWRTEVWVSRLPTYSLHCSSFLGLPFGLLIILILVNPKKGYQNGDYRHFWFESSLHPESQSESNMRADVLPMLLRRKQQKTTNPASPPQILNPSPPKPFLPTASREPHLASPRTETLNPKPVTLDRQSSKSVLNGFKFRVSLK